MNYFQLFGIPEQLKVEQSGLAVKFFELSRQYHPDYFVNKSPAERSVALDRSAMVNKAYRIFQDPDATIKYVLQLHELIEEEEKYELPADFLMEVLDLNEQLLDASSGIPDAGLTEKVDKIEKEIYEPVKSIIENYKEGVTTKEELLQVKEYYYKKKYLHRLKKQLGGIA